MKRLTSTSWLCRSSESQSSTRFLWREESPELTCGSRDRGGHGPVLREHLPRGALFWGAQKVKRLPGLKFQNASSSSGATSCTGWSMQVFLFSGILICVWVNLLNATDSRPVIGSRMFLLDESSCTSFMVRLSPFIFQCCLIYCCRTPNPGPFVHLKLAPWARSLPYGPCTKDTSQIQFSLFN